jgi:TolA-binding protein
VVDPKKSTVAAAVTKPKEATKPTIDPLKDAPPVVGKIAEKLDTATVTSELHDADFARLKALLAQIEKNLDLTADAVKDLQRTTSKKQNKDKAKALTDAEVAFDEVRLREQALRDSISRAKSAPPEIVSAAEEQVAADYAAYAYAVAAAESKARTVAE